MRRPRRILAATLGLAPQVLTETLYALHHARPRFSPECEVVPNFRTVLGEI